MKNKIVYKYIGKVLIGFAVLFIFPILVCLYYGENVVPFFIPLIVSLICGIALNEIKVKDESIYARDGFKIVALAWIVVSLVGALPIYLSGSANYIDSVFETASGFSTTGVTIFENVENLANSILFWRSFSHFIGGMGVLAFVMTVIPLSHNDKSMHVLKAEMPGPTVGKLVPSIKKTLVYLYAIYSGLTLIETILLRLGGISLFDSLLLAFGTAGTGGFAVLNSSIASYSTYCKYVITVFMFLFGVNFNLYFLMLIGDIKSALKSEELRVYTILFVLAFTFIFLNTVNLFANAFDAFTEAIFHTASVMTSTGYSAGDINIYPASCQVLFLALMIMSACAGSTCGGVKLSRVIIIAKVIKRDLIKLIHPSSVKTIKFEGKKISDDTIQSTTTFMFLYFILMIITVFIVSFDGFSLDILINAVFTTFANAGICFGISNFAAFSVTSKIALTIGMLLGRLEIFPMLVLIADSRKE